MLSLSYCKLYHGLYLLFLGTAAVKREARIQYLFNRFLIDFSDHNNYNCCLIYSYNFAILNLYLQPNSPFKMPHRIQSSAPRFIPAVCIVLSHKV